MDPNRVFLLSLPLPPPLPGDEGQREIKWKQLAGFVRKIRVLSWLPQVLSVLIQSEFIDSWTLWFNICLGEGSGILSSLNVRADEELWNLKAPSSRQRQITHYITILPFVFFWHKTLLILWFICKTTTRPGWTNRIRRRIQLVEKGTLSVYPHYCENDCLMLVCHFTIHVCHSSPAVINHTQTPGLWKASVLRIGMLL